MPPGEYDSRCKGRVVELLSELAEAGRQLSAGDSGAESKAVALVAKEGAHADVRRMVAFEERLAADEEEEEETVWQALTAAGVPSSHVSR